MRLFVCRSAFLDHRTAHDKQSKHNQLCSGRLGAPIIQLCFPHTHIVSQKRHTHSYTYEHKFIQYARKTRLMANILKVCKHTQNKYTYFITWSVFLLLYFYNCSLFLFCFFLFKKTVYDHVICACIYVRTWCTNVHSVQQSIKDSLLEIH